jgi:hypothetical protein
MSETDSDDTERNWWGKRWFCEDCDFVAHGYDTAEMHRRQRGHTLVHEERYDDE